MAEFLQQCGSWGVLATLAAYAAGVWINRKTGKALFNPLLMGSIFVIVFLSCFGVPYADYKSSAQPVSWLLMPATVSLAIPLYEKWELLEKLLPALRSRGLKVGIIKHDGHDFTPDVPGTDSYRLREAGAEGVAVYSGQRYLLTEMFRLTEQDLLALFERHGYDLVLLEGFKDSGWPKIEVVRKEISDTPVSFQPLAVVGDIPGADFGLEDAQALADWLVAQMPGL